MRSEHQKTELIDRVASFVRERLSRDKIAQAERFVRLFYANVPPDDILAEAPDDLYGAALSLWEFAQERQIGQPKVRVYNPSYEERGWHSAHSVVEIVNDDMPFLVDSVTSAIDVHGLTVHLVIHPVVAVARDETGGLSTLGDYDSTLDGAHRESLMHIQVDEQSSSEALCALRDLIQGVLGEVRAAVEDWRRMRDRLSQVVDGLERDPPSLPREEIDEVVALLRWMDEDRFTFLGFREYRFETVDSGLDLKIVPDTGLGILRSPDVSVFEGRRHYYHLPEEIQAFIRQPVLLMVTKANRRSRVHRSVLLDTIIIKRFNEGGEVTGEFMFVGLFTSVAYNQSARDIPYLRRKVRRCLARAGFDPKSHNGKALTHILDTYPRDELFQAPDEELLEAAMGILHLQERRRTALFVRKDPYQRFVSCLVYVPRDRYDTALRLKIRGILEDSFNGRTGAFYTQVAEGPHARLQFLIETRPGAIPDHSVQDIESRLIEAGRTWSDQLQTALVEARGEERGLGLFFRYGEAFPTSFRELVIPQAAIADIDRLETLMDGATIALNLQRPLGSEPHRAHFKLYHDGRPVPLSDVLPVLEHMGLKVIAEMPFDVRPNGLDASGTPRTIWLHDFQVESHSGAPIDLSSVKAPFLEAFRRVWSGAMEDDGFNRLVLAAGLNWRQVVVLRAYGKFLRQARFPFSQDALEDTLWAHPTIARLIVDLFHARFDPTRDGDREPVADTLLEDIETSLDEVENLDEDRILRRYVNLVQSTLRTSFFQLREDGSPKPYLSLKLDSRAIDELPQPRPMVEIFVYSPRVEGVHLRGGKVARGGIRWSDRREDFRTEILGLMKAQMVKNAVIVPVGSKGGFVVKRPPREGGREALQAEGIECYRTLIRGMLDVTDNMVASSLVAPACLIRHDGDDPYLVVAADKGTATFSDIANLISEEYGFWLGDAFASGGSAGYDHKRMGITARGGWESVKRHFRELGLDTQKDPFTVIGVGDMSGDVFGNGMLLSPWIRLVAAFNHLHIFVDPDPDPAVGFAERRRLFELGRGSWDLYDPSLISAGGGVFERRAKAIEISPRMRERFSLGREVMTPNELIHALLKAEIDLLWFGGIGTYVKADEESHSEVGDKANDAVRVNASDLAARVIGEGANLAVTQRGRIAAAKRGCRLNTDFIDNSAGVDCSDHEVNIKIALGNVLRAGDMTRKQRDLLLESMTDEVAALVLRDNYLQAQALSVELAEGPEALDQQARFMKALEKAGRLDRAIEMLPHDEELLERLGHKEGLTRPELAVLLCYAKIALYDAILDSHLPDDPFLERDLFLYFPEALRGDLRPALADHTLRREIIATSATNSIINRTGPTFVAEMMDKTGMGQSDIARAYLVVRESFALRDVWAGLEILDDRVDAAVQTQCLLGVRRLVERATLWVLRHSPDDRTVGAGIDHYRPGIDQLTADLEDLIYDEARLVLRDRTAGMVDRGLPEPLAWRIASLNIVAAGLDLIRIAETQAMTMREVAPVYFAMGHRLGIAWLRDRAGQMVGGSHWQKQAIAAVIDDLHALQADLTMRLLAGLDRGLPPQQALEAWIGRRRQPVERIDQLMAELKAIDALDISMLTVANRRLRGLMTG